MVNIRCNNFLNEAVNRLIIEANPSVDFTDRTNEQFNFDLTGSELAIIPSLMYERYLFRDFAYLKTLNVNYTPTEMRVFDPSNARSTFLNIYNTVCAINEKYIDIYGGLSRLPKVRRLGRAGAGIQTLVVPTRVLRS